MKDEEHGFIDVDEEEFLDWIREFDGISFEELLFEEGLGTESGPHGE